MSYFNSDVDTLRLPSDSAYTVTIKRRLKGGDHAIAVRACFGLEGAERYQAYMYALTPLMIVSWNLTDSDGIAPITKEAIEALEKEDFEFLWGEIDNRTALRKVEAERPFGNGSGRRPRATK